MRLFLDTNVLIDLIANRKPWVESMLMIFELANQQKIKLIAAVVAKREHADFIITRNGKDFKEADIPVLAPSDFLDYFFFIIYTILLKSEK